MENVTVNCLTNDYLRLQASAFQGNVSLAWEARKQFMRTPGIASFEVSPYSGKVFIGLDRLAMLRDDCGRQAISLLRQYFPTLVALARFKLLFGQCLHGTRYPLASVRQDGAGV